MMTDIILVSKAVFPFPAHSVTAASFLPSQTWRLLVRDGLDAAHLLSEPQLPSPLRLLSQPLQGSAMLLLLFQGCIWLPLHPRLSLPIQTQGCPSPPCRPRELGSQSMACPPGLADLWLPSRSNGGPFPSSFNSQYLGRDGGRGCGVGHALQTQMWLPQNF